MSEPSLDEFKPMPTMGVISQRARSWLLVIDGLRSWLSSLRVHGMRYNPPSLAAYMKQSHLRVAQEDLFRQQPVLEMAWQQLLIDWKEHELVETINRMDSVLFCCARWLACNHWQDRRSAQRRKGDRRQQSNSVAAPPPPSPEPKPESVRPIYIQVDGRMRLDDETLTELHPGGTIYLYKDAQGRRILLSADEFGALGNDGT